MEQMKLHNCDNDEHNLERQQIRIKKKDECVELTPPSN